MINKESYFFLIILIGIFIMSNAKGSESIRKSILAGSWYPASGIELESEVKTYLDKAKPENPNGRVFAIISPHAGYRYSGRAAAYGYKLIEGKNLIKRVIIFAPSHHWGFRGASILNVDYYQTPMGNVPVDKSVVEQLLKKDLFSSIPYADMKEHSLEIQLPFLQKTLSDFKIVPVVIGQLKGDDYEKIASAVKPYADSNTVFVASSDFTHFGYNFGYNPFSTNIKENLCKLDNGAVEKIINKDFNGFRQYLADTGITICGADPISIILKILPDNSSGKKLIYYTSGDVTGDFSSTVSYVSIVFSVPEDGL